MQFTYKCKACVLELESWPLLHVEHFKLVYVLSFVHLDLEYCDFCADHRHVQDHNLEKLIYNQCWQPGFGPRRCIMQCKARCYQSLRKLLPPAIKQPQSITDPPPCFTKAFGASLICRPWSCLWPKSHLTPAHNFHAWRPSICGCIVKLYSESSTLCNILYIIHADRMNVWLLHTQCTEWE